MENTTSEGAGQSPADHIDVDSLSESELNQAYELLKNPPPVVEAAVPEQVTEAEPQTGEVEETPTELVEQDEEEEDLDKAKRFRLHGPDRKYAALLKEGLKPAEAFKIAYPGEKLTPEPVAQQEEPPQVQLSASELIEQKIDELTAKQQEHLEMFENEEAAKLTVELVKLQKQLVKESVKEAVSQAQAQQAAESEAVAARDQFTQKAIEQYPAFGQEGSTFALRAQEIHEHLVSIGDPRVSDVDYGLRLAEWTAKDLGEIPVIPTKIKPTATAVASPKVVKPQPGLLATSSPTPMPLVDVEATLENLSAAELNILTKQLIEQSRTR